MKNTNFSDLLKNEDFVWMLQEYELCSSQEHPNTQEWADRIRESFGYNVG